MSQDGLKVIQSAWFLVEPGGGENCGHMRKSVRSLIKITRCTIGSKN